MGLNRGIESESSKNLKDQRMPIDNWVYDDSLQMQASSEEMDDCNSLA